MPSGRSAGPSLRSALAVAALLFVSSAAQANVGTPLLWMDVFHLVLLNALIGVLEGILLAKLFRLPRRRAIAWMVPANYFSLIAGWAILAAAAGRIEPLLPGRAPLFRAPLLLIVMGVSSWALSIVLEWPFVAAAMWRPRRLLAAFGASAIAQTVSYAILVPLYLLVSPISLFREGRIQQNLAFVVPPIAAVYYIDPGDRAVWRVRSDGTGSKRLMAAGTIDANTRLIAQKGRRAATIDLYRIDRTEGRGEASKSGPILTGIPGDPAPSESRDSSEHETWFNFWEVHDLAGGPEGEWQLRPGFWAGEGISVSHRNVFLYNLAFETPFASWICRNPTILPSHQAVFQLGFGRDSQIVMLDLPSRKIGFLTMGQGPAVVMDPTSQGRVNALPVATAVSSERGPQVSPSARQPDHGSRSGPGVPAPVQAAQGH